MEYQYKAIIKDLLGWYDVNKRSLPWRDVNNPYYIWVSEIMLQQTRVEAVKEYFYRFILSFPRIEDLASANEEQVLKLWEGLGYYNRVRNMHKTAKILSENYDNKLPIKFNELVKLPGIGTYTAGAISSIAYDTRVPAVDGNVLRIAMRLEASYEDIAYPKTAKRINEELMKIIPKRAGDFNQALMDLGSGVCIPKGNPKCENCPLSLKCLAYKKGLVEVLPIKTLKSKRKVEEKTILLFEYEGKYLLHQRESKGLLANLWEFPNIEGHISINNVKKMFDLEDETIKELGNANHIFSHIEWRMLGYYVNLTSITQNKVKEILSSEHIWADMNEIRDKYTIPNAFNAYKNGAFAK